MQRKNGRKAQGVENKEFIYKKIENQNLTAKSFFIEKAEFKIKTEEGEKRGLGTIRFIMPGKFLISIKSSSGIEVVRIFLTGDSVLANDRINKKMYYASASYLKSKYGLTTSILPVILGDYINDEKLDSNNVKCVNDTLKIQGTIKNKRINYLIDCFYGKSILTVPEDNIEENELQIRYSEFFKANNIYAPGKIEISDKLSRTIIEIKIVKIVSPWEGTVDFVPGKQYKKIHLL